MKKVRVSVLVGVALVIFMTLVTTLAAQGNCPTRTFTNELARNTAGYGTFTNTDNEGVTIAQVLNLMGATPGIQFTLQPGQPGGVEAWYLDAGLVRNGNTYTGIYAPNSPQKWIELNGGNPNGDNAVTVSFCSSGSPAGQAGQAPQRTAGAVLPAAADVVQYPGPCMTLWPIWSDNVVPAHDGSVNDAVRLSNELTSLTTVEAALVVNNQGSARLGNVGVTLYEAFLTLGAEPGDIVLAFPGQIGVGPGGGGTSEWYTCAGGDPINHGFSFVVPDITGHIGTDYHPSQWVEINGGNPDNNNAVVLVLLRDVNLNTLVDLDG